MASMTVIEPEPSGYDAVARANEFYARVGRVVSYCALMELWVFYLATTLDRNNTQQHHAGKHGEALVRVCRSELAKAPDIDGGLRVEITNLLDDITRVLKKRNVVVHSVVVQPGDPVAYAHRALPKAQRDADYRWTADALLTDSYLDELAGEIQDCLRRLYAVRPRAERGPAL
jgi:hypothetical protein